MEGSITFSITDRAANFGLGDDQAVDVQLVVVLGVGDGAFQRLLHGHRDAALGEGQGRNRFGSATATDQASHQVQLARADADIPRHRLRFGLREGAGVLRLAHLHQPRFAFLSDECPPKVRVGENSPNLWPTMFSETCTGMNFFPL